MPREILPPLFVIHVDMDGMRRVGPGDIADLTEKATAATFYRDGLTPAQVAENRRIVDISVTSCLAAARGEHQHLAAAFVEDRLAGYLIATRHGEDNLELDWLMVDPIHHGSGVAAGLTRAGIGWLGADRPIWLNVISYNARAIRFYEKFGFRIDADAATSHLIPRRLMRRPAGVAGPG